jgi:DNA-directed RNA polymerase subunit RPC12/RpoP
MQKPRLSDESGDMTTELASRFDCPHCGAQYKLVRLEAESVVADRQIACRRCGGPLESHDARHILKYFLVDRPRPAGRPRLVDRPHAERSISDRSGAAAASQEA